MADKFNQFCGDSTDLTTGSDPNCDAVFGAPEKLIFTTLDYEIATIALAESIDTYNTGIAAEEVFPLPLVEEFSNNSEEATYYTSSITSLKTFIKDGKQSYMYSIKFQPSLHSRLRKGLNGKSMRLFTVDGTNKITGTSEDDVIFKGWKSSLIRVEIFKPSDGSNLAFTNITFEAESTEETDDNIAIIQGESGMKDLNGIIPVSLTVYGTPTTTEIVVDLATSDGGTAIEGITDETDFVFTESSGDDEPVTGAAESSTVPGRYTLTGAAFTTLGTINLDGVVTVAGENYKGTAETVTI